MDGAAVIEQAYLRSWRALEDGEMNQEMGGKLYQAWVSLDKQKEYLPMAGWAEWWRRGRIDAKAETASEVDTLSDEVAVGLQHGVLDRCT